MGFDLGGAITGTVTGGLLGGGVGGLVGGLTGGFGLGLPQVEAPQMTQEEKDLLVAQKKYLEQQGEMLQQYKDQLGQYYPILLAQSGYKEGPDGKLVQLTQEEWAANMNPMQQAQYQLAMQQVSSNKELLPLQNELIKSQYEFQKEIGPAQQQLYKTYLEQAQLASEGKLPIPEYLQQELDKQRQTEESRLSQRLGPAAFLSSPGIQTQDTIDKRIAAIKDQYGHGEKQNAFGLLSGMSGVMQGQGGQTFNQYAGMPSGLQGYLSGNQATNQAMGQYGNQSLGLAGGYGNLAGGYGSAQQPYQYYQGLGFQADAQNTANMYGLIGDILGLGGTIGGMAMGGKK